MTTKSNATRSTELAAARGYAADELITAVAKAMWNVTVERERETPMWDELNASEQAEWKIYAGVAIKTVQQHIAAGERQPLPPSMPTDTKVPASTGGCSLEPLVLRLWETRNASKKAKEAFRAESGKGEGRCDKYDDTTEYRYCAQVTGMAGEMCDYCRARQPLYEAMQKAATEAGAALAAVLRAGKRLAQNSVIPHIDTQPK